MKCSLLKRFAAIALVSLCQLNAHSEQFFSQWDQDKFLIKEVFRYQEGGFFLDIGATDGIHISNTYYLEKNLGWNGICIEPQHGYFRKLVKNRNCTCVNAVLDYCVHIVEFFNGDPNGCTAGGIVDEDTDNKSFMKHVKYASRSEKSKRETTTLETVLDAHQAPQVIDYLSIDVEGAESRILMNFPFDRYIFSVITIERPKPDIQNKFAELGYVYIGQFGEDRIYIHPSLPNFDNLIALKAEMKPYYDNYE